MGDMTGDCISIGPLSDRFVELLKIILRKLFEVRPQRQISLLHPLLVQTLQFKIPRFSNTAFLDATKNDGCFFAPVPKGIVGFAQSWEIKRIWGTQTIPRNPKELNTGQFCSLELWSLLLRNTAMVCEIGSECNSSSNTRRVVVLNKTILSLNPVSEKECESGFAPT